MTVETRCGRITFGAWAASGFGLGFSPWAPGTMGTLGIAVLWGLLPPLDLFLHTSILAVVTVVGVPVCYQGERHFGHDAGCIVWDEFAGFLVAIWGIEAGWPMIALAFALFRLFDISKVFPVGLSQRLPGGWGVMVDDLIAGLYANLAIRFYLSLLA